MVYLDMKISPANGAWRLEIQQMGLGDAWKLGDEEICGGRFAMQLFLAGAQQNIFSKFKIENV